MWEVAECKAAISLKQRADMNKVLVTTMAAGMTLLTLSFTVPAQNVSPAPEVQRTSDYIASVSFSQAMYQLGREEDKKLGIQQDCKSQYEVKPIAALAMKPLEFSPEYVNPIKGVWMTRYALVRCGESKTYNALFFADSKGELPASRSFYPGATNAGPQLVTDAMRVAIPNAALKAKDCKSALVFDMRVTKPVHDVTESEKTVKGVWEELWTFKMCSQLVEVPITFIPDGKGGTSFVVSASMVKIVSAAP
jgi:hypothetical protein